MKLDIKKIKEQEAYFKSELYRVLKNYMLTIQKGILSRDIVDLLTGVKWERHFDVIPELNINGDRPDLLVTVDEEPFLVIETKKRRNNEVSSVASYVFKTYKYAKKLRVKYYMVCNGWLSFILCDLYPYLIGVYGVELTENFAKYLLLGLIKFDYKRESDIFSQLPRVPDKFEVEKKYIPSILRRLSKEKTEVSEKLLSEWLKKIH